MLDIYTLTVIKLALMEYRDNLWLDFQIKICDETMDKVEEEMKRLQRKEVRKEAEKIVSVENSEFIRIVKDVVFSDMFPEDKEDELINLFKWRENGYKSISEEGENHV